MPKRRSPAHKRNPSPYIGSRRALFTDPRERFVSGWDHEMSNDQGISRVIKRMVGVDAKQDEARGFAGKDGAQKPPSGNIRVFERISTKRLVPKGGKGTGSK